MNELELKYGCNPNQKPSRVFMRDGSDLPFAVLNGKPGYINLLDAFNSWQLVRGAQGRHRSARRCQLQACVPCRCGRRHAAERCGQEDLLR